MEKIKRAILICACVGGVQAFAQSSIVAAGADMNSATGTANQSIGQVVFTTAVGTSGTAIQGVQQPLEYSEKIGIDQTHISLEMRVFPNPAPENLTLQIEDAELRAYAFVLFDNIGNPLMERKVNDRHSEISLTKFSGGIYFLQVMKDGHTLKIFKIIKP